MNSAIEQLGAREVLFPGDLPLLTAAEGAAAPRFTRTELEEWVFTTDYAERTLRDHFKLLTLDGCGLANRPAAVSAAGAILHYLRETQAPPSTTSTAPLSTTAPTPWRSTPSPSATWN